MDVPPLHELRAEVESYLGKYLQSKSMVVPFKDRHSFADMTFRKIFNLENAKRLKRKLLHKYVHRKKEEYDEIGGWVVKYSFIKFVGFCLTLITESLIMMINTYTSPSMCLTIFS